MTQIAVKLSPDLLLRLRSRDGITADYAAQALGVGKRQSARLLLKAGAVRGTHHNRWYMPSIARLIDANRRWNNPVSATGSFEFTERSGHKADRKSGHACRTAAKADG